MCLYPQLLRNSYKSCVNQVSSQVQKQVYKRKNQIRQRLIYPLQKSVSPLSPVSICTRSHLYKQESCVLRNLEGRQQTQRTLVALKQSVRAVTDISPNITKKTKNQYLTPNPVTVVKASIIELERKDRGFYIKK